MGTWAERAAERLRAERTDTAAALAEHNLRKALAPQHWAELRAWLKEECKHLKRLSNAEILHFGACPTTQAVITRLKAGKPVARLKVEFDAEAERVKYNCGAGDGEYLFGTNLADSSVYFRDVYQHPFTVEEVGSSLLDKLLDSQF